MISSLLPVGGAALGALALETLRHMPPGKFLQELLNGSSSPSESPASSREATTATRITLDLPKAIPAFAAKLRQRLGDMGVGLEQPITLKSDGHGGILVDGDHPHRMLVEDLVAFDDELAADFRAIAAAATEEHERQSAATGGLSRDFRLRIGPQASTVGFE